MLSIDAFANFLDASPEGGVCCSWAINWEKQDEGVFFPEKLSSRVFNQLCENEIFKYEVKKATEVCGLALRASSDRSDHGALWQLITLITK